MRETHESIDVPMSHSGIVDLVKQERAVKPVVKITDFKVEFGLSAALK